MQPDRLPAKLRQNTPEELPQPQVRAIDQAAITRLACAAMDAGLIVLDLDGHLLWANPAYCDIVGRDSQSLIGKRPFAQGAQDVCSILEDQIANGVSPNGAKLVLNQSSGTYLPIDTRTSFHHLPGYGEVAVVVAWKLAPTAEHDSINIQQVDGARRAAFAHCDALTGLLNRGTMIDALDAVLTSSAAQRRQVGLIDIDVDHFKAVNDAHGSSAGDALLCHVARQLQATLTPADVLGRVDGDEFLVLRKDVQSQHELTALSKSLVEKSRRPLYIGGARLSASISVGAALAPPESLAANELLRRANFALSDAKQTGRGKAAIYDGALHARQKNQELIAQDLEQALAAGEVSFAFQPTFDAVAKKVRGFETLVRWTNPRIGPVSPATFLPIAKAKGLLCQLDQAAFQAALQHKQVLDAAGYPNLLIGFNGSAEFLAQDNFMTTFMAALDSHSVAPEHIVVEVLETVVFQDLTTDNPLVGVVKDLNDAGVIVLLDDFGTGYAGLTHLAQLAVSGVKIDRSLTRNVLKDQTSAKIIAMMLDLCRDLDLHVVTEGVETGEEADAIVALGGRVLQGYHYSKAMPADETLAWLATQPTSRP
ncbi:MAG: EAL domain-containing protein [Pseudomonadota bacterium]